ncbi:nucleotidyltransferase [Fructilactobacillus hinvesii]|uniref:tRNA(Met) cytidine acetate ligase n=1 Tax=Fructilactobacillus hinvesii TaxID=2940300 RepID=A0ABY5BT16_9LACO|nr:nucleotidyltransferase [Fructilactobacillus hinvesii]USS87587.1 nucleotidyltransferase [Fructilactobacillus hinvesii]
MKPTAVAIIAEYVPFHNGHLLQLQQAKRQTQAEVVIAVMSGNWTQRGEPALFDKWIRTQMALLNGVDLVVELPAVAAVQPAHLFAQYALQLVSALRCDFLAFGCEHANWDFNRWAQHKLEITGTQFLNRNVPFPLAFQKELRQTEGIDLKAPNDTLGFWYAQAAAEVLNRPQLVPIQRQVSEHGEQHLHQSISSGTAIRKAVLAQRQEYRKSVPEPTYRFMQDQTPITWEQFWPQLKYAILTRSPVELRELYQMTEGLEYRLQRVAMKAHSFAELIELVKTKRYTYPRLQRLCTYVLLNYQKQDVASYQPVLRILGMSAAGQRYLHAVKKMVSLPLITTTTKTILANQLLLEERAGLVTELVTGHVQDRKRSVIRKAAIKE